MKKILLISGKAGSGKDTAAEYIKHEMNGHLMSGFVIHYADLLKFICRQFYGWNGEKDEYGRWLLQFVGTDVVRKTDPDYWVDWVVKFVKIFDPEFVIIPDVRFPNEISKMVDAFGESSVCHIRIERDGNNRGLTDAQLSHESETALDNYDDPEMVFNNNGTLDEFKTAVKAWTRGYYFSNDCSAYARGYNADAEPANKHG